MCEKRIPFFSVTSSSKAHKEFKMHPTWSFLDGNWHKRSAANKARKVQTFQSWICHDWIYGVKSRIVCYTAYWQKYQKLLIRSNCSFDGKKLVFWTARVTCTLQFYYLPYILSRVKIKICYGYPSKLFFRRK